MNEFSTLQTLKDCGFIKKVVDNKVGYYKSFNGFKLVIVENGEQFTATIICNGINIDVPFTVDAMWVYGFNDENGGINYAEEDSKAF